MLSNNLSTIIENIIEDAIVKFNGNCLPQEEDSFRELLSLGELIDRLTIVNIKNFEFQDQVLESKDAKFKAEGVDLIFKLALERSRLKTCIDKKLLAYLVGKDIFNPELKHYKGI
jgi:hypothetical protein